MPAPATVSAAPPDAPDLAALRAQRDDAMRWRATCQQAVLRLRPDYLNALTPPLPGDHAGAAARPGIVQRYEELLRALEDAQRAEQLARAAYNERHLRADRAARRAFLDAASAASRERLAARQQAREQAEAERLRAAVLETSRGAGPRLARRWLAIGRGGA
jgi:hypothetical protein